MKLSILRTTLECLVALSIRMNNITALTASITYSVSIYLSIYMYLCIYSLSLSSFFCIVYYLYQTKEGSNITIYRFQPTKSV